MRQPEPRPRKPASETRELLLGVAVERVKSEGLLLDFANIELENLIRAAEVPRSTVFRIWPDRVAFVADLVRALFEADPGFDTGFDGQTLDVLGAAIASAGDESVPPDGEAALRAAIRVTVEHNIVAVEKSSAWRAYKAMIAALASGDDVPGGEQTRAFLEEIENRYIERMAGLYRQMNEAFGLRMREGTSEEDLALAIMSVIDGMSDHRRINPALVDRPRSVTLGPEGAQDWHLAAIAVYGVYDAFTEPAGS